MDRPGQEGPPIQELHRLIEEGDAPRLREFLDHLPSSELARALSRLNDDDRARLLSQVDPDHAASVVEQIPEIQAANAIERLDPGVAAAILHELPGSDSADLLGEVGQPHAEAILESMGNREAQAIRELCKYEDNVAGGLMTLEYLSYREDARVADVSRDLQTHAERYRDFVVQYIFVTTRPGRLTGVLRIRDLLLARPETPIRELMTTEPLSVPATASLNDLKAFFDRHALYGVPVVDNDGRLLGMIRRTAVEEALAERSDSALLKAQGIVGGEELRSMSVVHRSRRRLAWLSVNIVLNIVAASVIAYYQEVVAAVIALAVFIPIISDMSGCSGNQAVAVSMRELSLGVVRPSEIRRVWLKEVAVGSINGLVLGVLIAAVGWLWQGNAYLGLVIGLAMMLNTIVAVSIGGTVPLFLRRLGVDPALASGPILTTITDMCGFFLLLSIAGALLPRLTAG